MRQIVRTEPAREVVIGNGHFSIRTLRELLDKAQERGAPEETPVKMEMIHVTPHVTIRWRADPEPSHD